ncbi:MAG: site-specific DNA-methyltransferase [Chloroflexota bacterium]|nr:site-specific DNA-methyltransferase [Chloroflexota bacterium]
MSLSVAQRADLTFKHNRTQGRHGWLRLTPAYSVKVVREILDTAGVLQRVLDPFSGTGTTGLVCAEEGIACDLVEINPFLAWVAAVKTATYSGTDVATAGDVAYAVVQRALLPRAAGEPLWIPPIQHIERWWSAERLAVLARLFHELRCLQAEVGAGAAIQLNLLAFCRVVLEWSNAAFNHQSMSFKPWQPTLFAADEREQIADAFLSNLQGIVADASRPLAGRVQVYTGDSRTVAQYVTGPYDCVITSPPYPNRFSYIREVRPYMYWLGYLQATYEAGDLDWQAIGGTWGSATSWLGQWTAADNKATDASFVTMLQAIGQRSPLLANYVHKYFVDITEHLTQLRQVLVPGAKIHYIVGNSKFYDTLVPVDTIYAQLLEQLGFQAVGVEVLRKRNSKKELYEFVVSATYRPAALL